MLDHVTALLLSLKTMCFMTDFVSSMISSRLNHRETGITTPVTSPIEKGRARGNYLFIQSQNVQSPSGADHQFVNYVVTFNHALVRNEVANQPLYVGLLQALKDSL